MGGDRGREAGPAGLLTSAVSKGGCGSRLPELPPLEGQGRVRAPQLSAFRHKSTVFRAGLIDRSGRRALTKNSRTQAHGCLASSTRPYHRESTRGLRPSSANTERCSRSLVVRRRRLIPLPSYGTDRIDAQADLHFECARALDAAQAALIQLTS